MGGRERFGKEYADQQQETEQLLRDAKRQGNQGNVVMDAATGKMVIKSEDEMGGRHGKYWWGQTERELLIKTYVEPSTKSRQVRTQGPARRLA